jgi:hypothetical protein
LSANIRVDPPVGREDPYWRAQIRPAGSPFTFELAFVELTDPHELVLAGVEVQQPRPDEVEGPDRLKSVTAATMRELADHWGTFEKAARQTIELFSGESLQVKGRLGVRVRRELSPEFLADVVRRRAEFRKRGMQPTQALAREEGVSVSTVKNWMQKAREAGIEEAS